MNTNGSLTIEACQKKGCKEVVVEDDDLEEETESFNVTVNRPSLLDQSIRTQHRLLGVINILDRDSVTGTLEKQLELAIA